MLASGRSRPDSRGTTNGMSRNSQIGTGRPVLAPRCKPARRGAAYGATPSQSPADEFFVAEPCRAMVRRDHAQADPASRFQSVPELIAAIDEFIRVNNNNPKPFVWTKKVEDILEKIGHCKAIMRHYTSGLPTCS
jgi:hypothetical protein